MPKNPLKTVWEWIDDRLGLSELIGPMAKHPVPHNARWWYVFGSATLLAFIIQVVSGVALAFSYIPSSGEAYSSLQFITNEASFGSFLRAMHYFGASAMVLMVGIHALQVFLFGSYKFPRELNWVTGVLLLGLTLGMGFTGQLLRWDQTAVWSVIVAAEQASHAPLIGDWAARFTLGGDTVGGATLSRFFAIHVFVLPALIFAFIGGHLWLVLRHGISEPPTPGEPVDKKTYRQKYQELLHKTGQPFWPDSAWRDVVFGAAMAVVIILCALYFGPPELGKPPNPAIVEAYPRPDWYLLWYFAVLALLPPGAESVFIVFGPLLVGIALLLLPFLFSTGERSALRRPWAVASVILIVVMVGSLWRAGVYSAWSPDFEARPLPVQVVDSTDAEVNQGARLFFSKACINCHAIEGQGGKRGPDLTAVGTRLAPEQMTLRILNGAVNMPAFSNILKPEEVEQIVKFLQTRTKPLSSQAARRGSQMQRTGGP
ncbi:MAG: cytochrome b N-terminal domain-containing protein [Verrucomicrobiota bacterium]